ncbi:MAG: hypothetical protein WBH28_16000 [Fuerstiella sp.]
MQWFSQSQVAKQRNVSPATIAGLIDDGLLGAVNIARRGSVRRRYRISEKHLAEFDAARENPKPVAKESKSSGRKSVRRPVKDYFATTGGGK